MPAARKASAIRGLWAAVLLVLAGCGSGELPPCDTPERQAQAARVDSLPMAVRDSIEQAFAGRPRIQQVAIEQAGCHLRATVRVDSFATQRYASVQGVALLRALKEHAPGETRPLVEDPASEVGLGIYDYAVAFERRGTQQGMTPPGERGNTPWVHLTKPYHDRRATVRR